MGAVIPKDVYSQMSDRTKVYFKWMGAYWSCSPKTWERIRKAADNFEAIELNDEVTQLRSRPNARIETLKENR